MNAEREAYLAERARLREQFQRELDQIIRDALPGLMTAAELRTRTNAVMVRYLGADASSSELQQGLEDAFRAYEGLRDATSRRNAILKLARDLGVDVDEGEQ